MKANAVYEGKYLLGTSFARPIIAKRMVEIALKKVQQQYVMVQPAKEMIRFALNLLYKALAPHLKIIAPWRIWDIKSREDAIDYAIERKYSYSCY